MSKYIRPEKQLQVYQQGIAKYSEAIKILQRKQNAEVRTTTGNWYYYDGKINAYQHVISDFNHMMGTLLEQL